MGLRPAVLVLRELGSMGSRLCYQLSTGEGKNGGGEGGESCKRAEVLEGGIVGSSR